MPSRQDRPKTPIREGYDALRPSAEASGQGHLFTFWETLNEADRAALISDVQRINFAEVPALADFARSGGGPSHPAGEIAPAEVVRGYADNGPAREAGARLIAAGRVAAFTVAGGQGTRLGFAGPKGAFGISPVKNKPLFQLFAESVMAARRRYGGAVPWYIMTSPANHKETIIFFEKNGWFGLAREDVVFFEQGVMPAFDRQGRILLEERHRVALAPDGHGGSLLAMGRAGVLADMRRRGVEYISYFQVDNPLVHCVDPAFIGLHHLRGSEMSSKTLPKADDLERVGNFVMADGKLTVIEYSDLPESLARARNPDGSRRFDAGNIAIHALSRTFVERLVADPAAFALPWHRAEKKTPFVDVTSGQRVEPASPNAIKLESFIFDALPLARNPLVVETRRVEEFSPVKNATGVDSVETARRDLNRRAARWLEQAGVAIPRDAAGEPDGLFEISPLAAVEAGQLTAEQVQAVRPGRGAVVYVA